MAYIDYWSMLGFTNNANMMMEAFGSSSNIILTDNPEFTKEMFSEILPAFQFGIEEGKIPEPVFNMFKAMADKAIKYDRYKNQWTYLMCMYIAHFLTLFLQTQLTPTDASSLVQAAMPKGVITSKSVDSLSLSLDMMDIASDFSGYGMFKMTSYGMQLLTITKMYGHTGMWVNG